jgi:catecholate siderophore receptor
MKSTDKNLERETMTGLKARLTARSIYPIHPSCAAVLAALACTSPGIASSAEETLREIVVHDAAAERPDGPVKDYHPTRSSTATRTDTPLKEIPASITVVPAEVIKDQAMQGLGDVLRYVPGVTVHQGEGNRDQVVIRGISTTADFYVNGVRDDAQIFRDLYNLERVEVLKGPAGMIFGRGGAGGVVNRVTKRPIFGRIAEASVTVGSYDQARTTIDFGNKLNDSTAFRLNAMAERADSFRDGVDLGRYAFNPTILFALSDRTALTLDYEHLHDDRTADRGIPSRSGAPFDTGRNTFFGNADQSDARSTVDALSAVLDHDFGGGMQFRNTLRIARYDKLYQNVYAGSAVNAAGTLSLSAYNNANLRTNVFNQSDLTTKFSTAGFQHTLLTGVEIGRQNSSNKRNTGFFGAATSATVSAANPFAIATSFSQTGTDANNAVQSDVAAVYMQDQIALSPQWKVLAGVRYDRFKVDFDDRRTTSPAVDLSRTDTAFSPRAGLIWTPTPGSSYYVSYSYAFLPSGEQLSLAPTTADLAPEKAKNYEVGARWDLMSKLTLSAAVFRLDRDDVRVADPLNPGFFVKTGQQRTEGIELGLQGEITRWWQIFGGYAHLDGRIIQPITNGTAATAASVVPAGNKIGLVPDDMFSFWNKFALGAGWGAGLGVIRQSSSYTSFNNTVTLPGFTRVDGALYYTFAAGRTRLALNVENLFDKKYFPTVDGDNNISPGAPINARVTLTTVF